MNISGAIRRFERRSRILQWQAWSLLLIVLALMAFGGYIVFTASSLTARDIGGPDFDKRLESTDAELSKLNDENKAAGVAVAAEISACGKAYAEFFRQFQLEIIPSTTSFRDISFGGTPPSGDEIARQVSLEVQKFDANPLNKIGLRFNFSDCDPSNVSLLLPRARFSDVTAALAGRSPLFDRTRLDAAQKRSLEISDRINFTQSVRNTIYDAKVRAAASGSAGGPPTQSTDSDLLLRLIQTSITRFGVLAVIGFLVSILVSLYRYNIRLSAFYIARADILRLSGEHTTVSDFAVLAAALTPHLEFGKAPPPPLAQLSDLIKSVKDAK
jgi:hypothetical protein